MLVQYPVVVYSWTRSSAVGRLYSNVVSLSATRNLPSSVSMTTISQVHSFSGFCPPKSGINIGHNFLLILDSSTSLTFRVFSS